MNSNGDCNIKNQVKEDRFSEPENTAKVNMGNDSSLRFSVRRHFKMFNKGMIFKILSLSCERHFISLSQFIP